MKRKWMPLRSGVVLSAAMVLVTGLATAQQVYRCEQANGSVTFSDLPCRSESGHEARIDATPHQGHRDVSAAPAADVTRSRFAPATANRRAAEPGLSLNRNERLTLERRRAELLSGLKRRHVKPAQRRAMIAELRGVDQKLGIGPVDVADMPFHNREIYEDNQVFRSGKP